MHFPIHGDLPTNRRKIADLEVIGQGYTFLSKQLKPGVAFQSLVSRPDVKSNIEQGQPTEIFSSLLIGNLISHHPTADLIRDQLIPFLKKSIKDKVFSFFSNRDFPPPDINTSSLGFIFLMEFGELSYDLVKVAVDRMIENQVEPGMIQLYFNDTPIDDPRAGKVSDPVACLNFLYLLNMIGRSEEGTASYQLAQNMLITRRYMAGTSYYPSPDSFLFFLTRLVAHFPFLKFQWANELKRAVAERLGQGQHALDFAMQVYMAKILGLPYDRELRQLLQSQFADGGWPSEVLLEDGEGNPLLASRALTTAFCLHAIETTVF